jgi:hypothetical protein
MIYSFVVRGERGMWMKYSFYSHGDYRKSVAVIQSDPSPDQKRA